MSRLILGIGFAALTIFSTANTAYADGKTIRIEPRPFYGATVSIEAGVRVFRPVPPTTHMIINPNKTPLSVSIKEETRTINKNVRHSGSHGGSASGHGSDGIVGSYGYSGGKFGRRGKPRRLGRFPGH